MQPNKDASAFLLGSKGIRLTHKLLLPKAAIYEFKKESSILKVIS